MKRFLRRTTLPASFALVLLMVGCPQFFVYDLQQASINHETIETAPLLAAGAPQYTATPVLGGATVTIPDGNPTFSTDQIINLTSATEGATIHYIMTTDDTEPSDPNPYANSLTRAFNPNSPFVASGDGRTIKLRAITLKAQAYPSEYVNRQLTISYSTTDSPAFSPAAGTYTGELSVVLSSAGADIWYALTTDGTDPGAPAVGSSSLYTGPIAVTGQAWIRAIAVAPQKRVSGEVVAQYFVGPEAPTVQSVGAPPLWYDIAGFAVGGSTPTFQALPGAGSNAGFRAKIDAPPGTTATAQADEYDFDSTRTIPLTTPGNYALYVRQRGTDGQWSAATKFPFQIYNVIRVDSSGDVISADNNAILREAIVAAETNAPYKDATTGRADVMDLIDMRGFPVTTVTLTAPLPALSESTIIVADPGTVRIDGAAAYRIFTVTGGVVVIDNLTLKQGVARGQNGAGNVVNTSGGGGAAGMGGALYIDGSTAAVMVTNATFSNNSALGGLGGNHGNPLLCGGIGGNGGGPAGGAGAPFGQAGAPGGFGSGGGGGGGGGNSCLSPGPGPGGAGGFGGGGGGGGANRDGGNGASGGPGSLFGGAGGFGCCAGSGGGGGGAGLGGAIFLYRGSVDVSSSTFNANVATGALGGSNYTQTQAASGLGKGGAIFVASGATFTQSGLVFNANAASNAAGTANDNNDIYDGN